MQIKRASANFATVRLIIEIKNTVAISVKCGCSLKYARNLLELGVIPHLQLDD
jgi:bacterioferritin-associated ferredoxin